MSHAMTQTKIYSHDNELVLIIYLIVFNLALSDAKMFCLCVMPQSVGN